MHRSMMSSAVALAFFLAPAIALADCKSEIQEIDQTMASSDMSDADKEKAMDLRNAAEKKCQQGNESEAEVAISEVKQMLGLN